MNKVQGYLNEIGRVKHEANKDFKIFVDRFKKLIGDVRSIDLKQVPTDVNLMGILKEALSLWGHLMFEITKSTIIAVSINCQSKGVIFALHSFLKCFGV